LKTILKGCQYALLLLLTISAHGHELLSSIPFDSAQVAPAGVRVPRLINLSFSVDSRYDSNGSPRPLAWQINRPLKWSDLLQSQTGFRKMGLKALLEQQKIDPSGGPGQLTGEANAAMNIMVPVLAAGITDRFSLGIAVPIVKTSVSATSGFVKSEEGQKVLTALNATAPVEGTSAADQINHAVDHGLQSYGMEPFKSKNTTHVGDIQVVGKYLLYDGGSHLVSLRSTLVLPTGTRPNPDAVIDLPTGDGRYQTGLGLSFDQVFAKDYRWNVFGHYLALLPNQMERRIPTEADNPISSEKESLTRKLGSIISTGTSITRDITAGFSAGVGYAAQYFSGNQYEPGQFEPIRYQYLADLAPSQLLHSATIMAGFSTVDWFLKKKFFYPFMANFYYSTPLASQNAPRASILAGELTMFF
jgi:hypothetical protein